MITPQNREDQWVLAQWANLCAQHPGLMAVFDTRSCYVAVSERWRAAYESGAEAVIGSCCYDLHPEMPAHWRLAHGQALNGETVSKQDEYFLTNDGSACATRWTCAPWRYPDETIGGFTVSVEDLTQEEVLRHRLNAAEQELHLALSAARAGTWEFDCVTLKVKWSAETWRLYGLIPGSVEPSMAAWAMTVVPEQRARLLEMATQAISQRQPIEFEWQVNLADEERWLLCRGAPILGSEIHGDRYVGIVIDVTARKLAERRNEILGTELRAILDAMPIGVIRLDSELRYRFANRWYANGVGIPAESLVGKALADVIGEPAYEFAVPYIAQARDGKTVSFENTPVYPDNKERVVIVTLVPDVEGGDGSRGQFAVIADMTDLRQREAENNAMRTQLESDMQRMVVQQTLMAVAHDLRQPLLAAAAFAKVAQKMVIRMDPQAGLERSISRMAEETQRANQVLNDLFAMIRDVSLGGRELRTRVDLRHLVAPVVVNARDIHNCTLTCISVEAGDEEIMVRVNPALIERSLGNLLANALDAQGCSGDCCKPVIRVSLGRRDGLGIITVEDSAGGIPEPERKRLFEPFRTTKKNGLGLGLSISRQLVELEGGQLWYEERPDGSAFCLGLPLCP